MLSVKGLRKTFGSLVAVDDVSFTIPDGICFGLLGPNGAGKTTTISMIVGILDPDAGETTLDGVPSAKAKASIAFVPQELALYEPLTANDNLSFFAALYGLEGKQKGVRMDHALEVTGLSDRRAEPVSTYSGGMKRRLNIAIALLHDPKLIILDEPTVGVDPQSRNAIFEALESLLAEKKTLLYTTHYMEEAERLCRRVAIMDGGRVVAEDDLAGLHRRLPQGDRLEIDLDVALDWKPQTQAPMPVSFEGSRLSAEVPDLTRDLPCLLSWLGSEHAAIVSMRSNRPSLEEVFLHLTGRSLRD